MIVQISHDEVVAYYRDRAITHVLVDEIPYRIVGRLRYHQSNWIIEVEEDPAEDLRSSIRRARNMTQNGY